MRTGGTAMKIERTGTRYRIVHGTQAVEFGPDKFEDLFYAGAVNPTGFYRLLVDNVCDTAAQRTTIAAIVQAQSDMASAFATLQAQIKALGPP